MFLEAFLFRLWIRIVYHEEKFLISNNPIEQDLGSTEDTVEHPNKITAFLL